MLLRILPFLLCLVWFPIFLFYKFYSKKNWKPTSNKNIFFFHLFWGVILIVGGLFEGYGIVADFIRRTLLMLTIWLGITELTFIMVFFLCIIFKHKFLSYVFSLLSSFLVFSCLGYGFIFGSSNLVIKKTEISLPNLPKSFVGYKVVFFSDLHIGTLKFQDEIVAKIINDINIIKPDLVIFGGDLVNYHPNEVRPYVKILSQIKSKNGVISIMGNHDYLNYYKWNSSKEQQKQVAQLQTLQKEMGWKLLLNQSYVVKRGNDSIVFVGLENEGDKQTHSQQYANYSKAVSNVDKNALQIILQHNPKYWRDKAIYYTNAPLMLAGHTHAMQFQIGKWSPAEWFYSEWSGKYAVDKNHQLIVSPGVGEILLPFRLGAWPQIELIILK